MESIEFFHYQLSFAREIAVSHKNYILTDRIIAQIQSDNVYVDKSSLCVVRSARFLYIFFHFLFSIAASNL